MGPGASLACNNCKAPLRPGEPVCAQCGTPVSSVGGYATPADAGRDTPATYGGGVAFSWDAVVQRLREITLGEYEVLTELGRGGMAAVFLAHEHALNRKVALKVMSPATMMGEGMIERFYAEAVMQANLIHPHIVTVHAVRQEEDLHYFVMQFLPGRSLLQVVRGEMSEGRWLSLPVIRSLVYQIGSALAFAHRRGVIHRDIKPANALLNGDGDAVVTDFGIAKVAASPSQTMTGTVVGTAPYMSPEQCYALELTGASDQYSLGILTYELLTGAPPFSGNSFVVMQAHTSQAPAPIENVRPDCPPDVAAAVMRMLAKSSEDRFPDINAALEALEAKPASSNHADPLRRELIRLSDVRGVEKSLASALHVPLSPMPRTRRPGDPRRATPTPRSVPAYPPTVAPPQSSEDARVAMLRLSDPPARVEVGGRLRLAATATDSSGTIVSDVLLRWSSSNPKIARVSVETGEIEALEPGGVDIVATTGSAVATVRLNVAEPVITSVVVSAPNTIEISETTAASVEIRDSRGMRLERAVAWSSRDSRVLSVDTSGRITAMGLGVTRVVASAGGMSGECEVRVTAAPAVRLEIAGLPDVLGPREIATATATLYDKRGNAIAPGSAGARSLRWESSDPNVLVISQTGVVTALLRGQARIVARCDEASASVTVSVGVVPIARLDVEGMPTSVATGKTRRLAVRTSDHAGRTRDLPIEWGSSNPEIATVDNSGQLIARSPGEVTVRVRSGSMERSFPISVVVAVPLSERLRAVSALWPVRIAAGVVVFAAIGLGIVSVIGDAPPAPPLQPNQNAAVQPSPEPVIRTDPTPPQQPPPQPPPQPEPTNVVPSGTSRVSISGPRSRVAETGDRFQLSAGGQRVVWSSSDPSVASIDGSGNIATGVEGTAVVRAVSGAVRDSITISVRPPTISRLTLVSPPSSLREGEGALLSVSAFSERGRSLEPDGVRWISSNPRVLSVNAVSGLLRGNASGSAEVYAEIGGIRSSSHTITIEAAPRVEAPAPKAADPIPPRVTETSPSSSTESESVIAGRARDVAAGCRDAYASRDTTRIEPLARGGNQIENANWSTLRTGLRDGGNVVVESAGAVGDPVIEGATARVDIPMRAGWRDRFSRNSAYDVTLRAELQRSGLSWTLTNCRIASMRRR